MTPTPPGAAAGGTSFRPLPPPILESPAAPAAQGEPIVTLPAATLLDPPDLVIVPASDIPVTNPVLPDRASSRQRATAWMRAHGREADALALDNEESPTAWLRTDPPPVLMYTMWLRVVLALLMLGALGASLWFRYTSESNEAADAKWVVGLHAGVIGAIIVWSFVSMRNAAALVPATRYQTRSRGWVAASLWLVAIGAPIGGIVVSDAARELFDDPDHVNFVFVQMAIGFVVLSIVWLPFRYLAVQSSRIGAARSVMFAWFWLPVLAIGGGQLIMALGLRSDLEADGWTDTERLIEAGVVYGLPMLLFALTAWRATSAFDSVISVRWRRWQIGWEQSEVAFSIVEDANR